MLLARRPEGLYCEAGWWPTTITCCDFLNYHNFGGDCGDTSSAGGNFFEDPLFCNPDNEDFTLDCFSPCVHGYGCGLVGALDVGCGPSSVREEHNTWGGIKEMYR